MKIYVMRHGTTVWNEKGITQGRSNNRLSENGKALTCSVACKYKNIKFDVIFCSPLMRTMQTANLMNEHHNAKIIKDNRLIEIDQGVFTGARKSNLTDQEKKLKNARAKECGLESYQSVYKRVESFVNELKQNKKYENVLIVTHNINATFIDDILSGANVGYDYNKHSKKFNNAEIRCFEI